MHTSVPHCNKKVVKKCKVGLATMPMDAVYFSQNSIFVRSYLGCDWRSNDCDCLLVFQVTQCTEAGITVRFMQRHKGDMQLWTWPDVLLDYFYKKDDPCIIQHLMEPAMKEIHSGRRNMLAYYFKDLLYHSIKKET